MTISFFTASIGKVITRYYLMMASVILPFFLGVPLLAIIAIPLFLSAISGFEIKLKTKQSTVEQFQSSTEIPSYN